MKLDKEQYDALDILSKYNIKHYGRPLMVGLETANAITEYEKENNIVEDKSHNDQLMKEYEEMKKLREERTKAFIKWWEDAKENQRRKT